MERRTRKRQHLISHFADFGILIIKEIDEVGHNLRSSSTIPLVETL